MTEEKLPTWFWVVAVLAVLWNLMGCAAYYMDVTMTPEMLAELPQADQDLRAAIPAWITGLYAIAVFVGLAGAIMLCLRKKLAIPLYIVSLVAVVVQMGYISFGMNSVEVRGAVSLVFPVIIIVLGALQLWFSINAKGRGWLT